MTKKESEEMSGLLGICKVCGRWFDREVPGSEKFCIDCMKNIRQAYGDNPPAALGSGGDLGEGGVR